MTLEMFSIDWTVIGSERRRWHPVNPFPMKRHGDHPTVPALDDPAVQPGQPITEMVNGTFCYLPLVCLVFSKKLPQFPNPNEKFEDL